jgi:hypothetical protein
VQWRWTRFRATRATPQPALLLSMRFLTSAPSPPLALLRRQRLHHFFFGPACARPIARAKDRRTLACRTCSSGRVVIREWSGERGRVR